MWLQANCLEGLPLASRSAEDYGTLLTAELERATVLDEPVLAVCIDLARAYDSVRLDLLEFLLEGTGLPSQVWRPMLDMARAPRRLKVMTAVGHRSRLPSGHLRRGPAAGAVAAGAWPVQLYRLDPVLGRRQRRLEPWRHGGPGGLGRGHPWHGGP